VYLANCSYILIKLLELATQLHLSGGPDFSKFQTIFQATELDKNSGKVPFVLQVLHPAFILTNPDSLNFLSLVLAEAAI
jgi:hypothetical protein